MNIGTIGDLLSFFFSISLSSVAVGLTEASLVTSSGNFSASVATAAANICGEAFGLIEASKMPRQSLPEAYVQNSCVNVINPETILKKNSSLGTKVLGVVMKREESVNIDDLLDFEIAEMIMQKRLTRK